MASYARQQGRCQAGAPGRRRHMSQKLLRIFWSGCRAGPDRELRSLGLRAERLYSLTSARASHCNLDLLNLALSGRADDLKCKIIIADKILGRSVNCDKGRDLNSEALLEVGCSQAPLFHGHLAVG